MWDDPVNMPNILSPDNASLAFLKEVFLPRRNRTKVTLCIKLTSCVYDGDMMYVCGANSSTLEFIPALLVSLSDGPASGRTGPPRDGVGKSQRPLLPRVSSTYCCSAILKKLSQSTPNSGLGFSHFFTQFFKPFMLPPLPPLASGSHS